MHFRTVDNKYYWMRCTLPIGLEVFRNANRVAYKYVIHSPNLKDARKHYSPVEYLHHSPSLSGHINRCLTVPVMKGKYTASVMVIFYLVPWLTYSGQSDCSICVL